MSGVEVGLGVLGAVDVCLKYGKTLADICAAYRGAEDQVRERVIRYNAIWTRTKYQLQFLHSIGPTLEQDIQESQEDVLLVLAQKLSTVEIKIKSILKNGVVDRLRFAVRKENLDRTLVELQAWQETVFDPTWYQNLKLSTSLIDTELSKRYQPSEVSPISIARQVRAATQDVPVRDLSLPTAFLEDFERTPIQFCSAILAEKAQEDVMRILEHVECPPYVEVSEFSKRIRSLASKVSRSDPHSFRLLQCLGYTGHMTPPDINPKSFTFVLKVPPEFTKPQSLRSCLLDKSSHPNLSDKFQIANELAKSISYVHTFGFVHKNVRPESILLFQDGVSSIGSLFVVGFGHFRGNEDRTSRHGDASLDCNLYRHPRRQGNDPADDYVMQHDIYSLGVCLLEIGMWESFISYHSDSLESSVLSSDTLRWSGSLPGIKNHLVSLARKVLPERMGGRYAEIVQTCLTCLDDRNFDFGDERELYDKSKVLVGARFIEKVLMRLHDIRV